MADGDFDPSEPDVAEPFRSSVVLSMWLVNQTHREVINAVRAVARYYAYSPKLVHWEAVLRVCFCTSDLRAVMELSPFSGVRQQHKVGSKTVGGVQF